MYGLRGKNGITVIGNYIDRALSARTDNRPEFRRMIKDSAKGCFDVVLVWKLDRFSRDRYDSAHYKYILKKNGVKVISAKENISEGPEGIILETMLEGMTEYYSVELAVKVKRGMMENVLKLKTQLSDVLKKIEKIIQAIEQGIIFDSTRDRLAELEKQKSELEVAIFEEQIERPLLTQEQIRFGIERFRKFKIDDEEDKKRLIDNFINAIYLYDDKIMFTFNYKDGTKTVLLSECDSSSVGSDTNYFGPPRET